LNEPRTSRADVALAVVGACAFSLSAPLANAVVHFGLFLDGLAHTSLPAAVALVSLEPLAVVLAAWMAFGLRSKRREIAGVVLATLGAAWVARAAGTGENRIAGDLMVLAAVVAYGAYVATARGLRDTTSCSERTVGAVASGAFAQSPWPTKDEWIGAGLIVAGATMAILGRPRAASIHASS
jgi:drug/metabolite transporter (DMT)-like permease